MDCSWLGLRGCLIDTRTQPLQVTTHLGANTNRLKRKFSSAAAIRREADDLPH